MAADRTPGFETLKREHAFKHPDSTSYTAPILHELVAPHIESFNSLFDDSGLALGDGKGEGLLSLALKDIGSRVLFDGAGKVGESSGQAGWGNKLECEQIWQNRIFDPLNNTVIS